MQSSSVLCFCVVLCVWNLIPCCESVGNVVGKCRFGVFVVWGRGVGSVFWGLLAGNSPCKVLLLFDFHISFAESCDLIGFWVAGPAGYT
jgi:hypothetical protein